MLNVSIKKGQQCHVKAAGDPAEIAGDICNLISSVYSSLFYHSPRTAIAFREALCAVVADDGIVWEPVPPKDGEMMMVAMNPKRKEETE